MRLVGSGQVGLSTGLLLQLGVCMWGRESRWGQKAEFKTEGDCQVKEANLETLYTV